MFNRKPIPDDDLLKAANPVYLAGRREWNERYGDYIAQARSWRLAAIGSIAVAAVAVAGMVYLSSQSRIVPYVVAVDHLGDQLAIRRADVAAPADPRVIRADLSRWIEDTRSVYTDPLAERREAKEAYSFINAHSMASSQMDEWFTSHEPFKRAKDETVSVAVESVLPISPKTWRVEWREDKRSRNGSGANTSQEWQAVVTISVSPPTTDAEILANPIGLYIDSFSWSERT